MFPATWYDVGKMRSLRVAYSSAVNVCHFSEVPMTMDHLITADSLAEHSSRNSASSTDPRIILSRATLFCVVDREEAVNAIDRAGSSGVAKFEVMICILSTYATY